MSLPKEEIIRWLKSLPSDAHVGVDEGGLCLVNEDDQDCYLELGGLAEEEPPKIKFLVIDEDKLVMSYPGKPWEVEILATKASAMLPPYQGVYPRRMDPNTCRPATKADFESFRVKLEQFPEETFEIPTT